MSLNVVPARSLTPDHVTTWRRLQRAYPELRSPFLHPGYTQAVAAIQDGVEVIIFESAGEPVAFLPFQRQARHTALSVGGKLCDYQGVIGDPTIDWDVAGAMRAADVTSWFFDHQIVSRGLFEQAAYGHDESPHIDLSHGVTAYLAAATSSIIKTTRTKMRRLERRLGPIRYEAASTDVAIFDRVIALKSERIRTTKGPSIFDDPRVVATLRHLFETRTAHFGAVLSTLHAGGHLVAADIDLRAGSCHHGWLPTYEREFRRESPGLCLMLARIDAAESTGIMRIDLGKGPEGYKRQLMNGVTPLRQGCVDLRPGAAVAKRAVFALRNGVLASPLHKPLRVVARRAVTVTPNLKNILWMR